MRIVTTIPVATGCSFWGAHFPCKECKNGNSGKKHTHTRTPSRFRLQCVNAFFSLSTHLPIFTIECTMWYTKFTFYSHCTFRSVQNNAWQINACMQRTVHTLLNICERESQAKSSESKRHTLHSICESLMLQRKVDSRRREIQQTIEIRVEWQRPEHVVCTTMYFGVVQRESHNESSSDSTKTTTPERLGTNMINSFL